MFISKNLEIIVEKEEETFQKENYNWEQNGKCREISQPGVRHHKNEGFRNSFLISSKDEKKIS